MAAQCLKCGDFEIVELVIGDQFRQMGCRACDALTLLPRAQQLPLSTLIASAVADAERDWSRLVKASQA